MQDLQEQHGLAYMFITHDLSVVKHISDDILVMYLGKMVEKCPAKELFRNHLHLIQMHCCPRFLCRRSAREKPCAAAGGTVFSDQSETRMRFANRCPYASDICLRQEPELREVLPGHFVACHKVDEFKKKGEISA